MSDRNISDKKLKLIVAAVIVLLLLHQMGVLISGIFGVVWGGISTLAVAAVSFFSARLAKAGGKRSFWFLLPTLLFTILPILLAVWMAMISNTSWFDRLVSLSPLLIGFVLPIILLSLIYIDLRNRSTNDFDER